MTATNNAASLSGTGVTTTAPVHANLTAPGLYAHALRRGEGRLSADGAFIGVTGVHTGRSVADKFVADDPEATKEIWWGKVNQKLDPAKFDAFTTDVRTWLGAQKELFTEDLYAGGLNRALFLPFIGMIEERMEVLALDADTDYRMLKLEGVQVWHTPLNEAAHAALDAAFAKLAGPAGGHPSQIMMKGRSIPVPAAANGAARFTFQGLCEQPLGANDYLRIARTYHTVLLEGIPILDGDRRNEAKRFISLIDTFYDGGVKLIASAAAEPEALYLGTEGAEAFEWARTVSRLHEMRSGDYLSRPHGHPDSRATGNTTGLVET
jgi:hypothetical protein